MAAQKQTRAPTTPPIAQPLSCTTRRTILLSGVPNSLGLFLRTQKAGCHCHLEATEPLMPRKQGSGTACRSLHPSDKAQWCRNCCSRRAKCTGLPTGTAAEPKAPKPQPEQRVAPNRDAVRDVKQEYSPSRKMSAAQMEHHRRDHKRGEHNQDRLGSHLSNLAAFTTPSSHQGKPAALLSATI